jgi:hypothetical protein
MLWRKKKRDGINEYRNKVAENNEWRRCLTWGILEREAIDGGKQILERWGRRALEILKRVPCQSSWRWRSSWKEKRKGKLWNRCRRRRRWSGEMGSIYIYIYIYIPFSWKGTTGIWHAAWTMNEGLFERDSRCWFRKGNHDRNDFEVKDILLRNWGACVDAFFDRCQDKWRNGASARDAEMSQFYWCRWAWGSDLGGTGVCSLEIGRWYLYRCAEGIFQMRLGLGWCGRWTVCFIFRKSLSFFSRYVPAVID